MSSSPSSARSAGVALIGGSDSASSSIGCPYDLLGNKDRVNPTILPTQLLIWSPLTRNAEVHPPPRLIHAPFVFEPGLPLRLRHLPPQDQPAGCDASDANWWSWRCAARADHHLCSCEACWAQHCDSACFRCRTLGLFGGCATFSRRRHLNPDSSGSG